MPRSKPIPSQVLQKVEQGDLASLDRLERLISRGNVTEEVLTAVFKCLTFHPVPVASDWVSEIVLRAGLAVRPSACLSVLWKIFDWISREETSRDFKLTFVKHLLESGDLVLGWTRVCLQGGLPCIPDNPLDVNHSPRASRYLTLAHYLVLMRLDEDYGAVMRSSTAFINLFLELWLVEDRRDRSGKLIWRILDSKVFIGCPIIDIADRILTDDTSRGLILKRCVTAQQCDLFSRALMDRVTRGWEGENVPIVGWARSLGRLVSITTELCKESPRFRSRLTRAGHLLQLCTELGACSKDILGDREMSFLVTPLLSSLSNLMDLALLDKRKPSNIRHNWRHINSGHFIEALFRATLMVCPCEDDEESSQELDPTIKAMITTLGQCLAQPWFFSGTFSGTSPRPLSLELKKLEKFPAALQAWSRLLELLDKGAEAFMALQTRSGIYFCDNLPCALSGKEFDRSSKQCSGCRSVVYCSQECQGADWRERHHQECYDIQGDHTAREIPSGRYLHQTRAFRVALLECMDDSYPYGDHATSWDYDKTYFQPRREALLAASQNIPPGWRLEECVVPIVGGGNVVRLAALFKPTDKGFRGVYCVEEYS